MKIKNSNYFDYLMSDDVIASNHYKADHEERTTDFLKTIKRHCIDYSIAYKIMEQFSEDEDVAIIQKLVYCANTDVVYVYTSNYGCALFIKDRLSTQLSHYYSYFKGISIDELQDVFVLELNFCEPSLIERNKTISLKTISI